MSKERFCAGCVNDKNGWCTIKKTNKGLRDLNECNDKKLSSTFKLEGYIKQKEYEAEIDNTSYNKGLVKGLKIALKIINED